MSTTVTYKGSTLTTVSNDTVTLETGGTWLEDDITLTDVTSSATLGTKTITANGTYEAYDDSYDGYSEVSVNVPASAVDSGTKTITTNGTHDVVGYASASVNVPNTYSASDEGKVVDSGALVSQTSATYTENGTYNTTLISEVTVNVSGGNANVTQDANGYIVVADEAAGSGGGISIDDIATNTEPSGIVVLSNSVTALPQYALAGKPVTSVTGQNITDIKQLALQGTSIESITDSNFPSLGTDSQYTLLLSMSSLKHIKLSGQKIALSSGSYALRNNSNLETAEFPNAAKNVGASFRGMGQYCFGGCPKLELVDCGYVQSVSANAFNGDTVLAKIILRYSSVVPLNNVSAFSGTPFASGGTGGEIYVPNDLIDSYKAASNWSTINGYGTITWKKIEDSEYDYD